MLVQVAINLIVQHVQTQLVSRGFKLRSKLAEGAGNGNGQYIMPGTLSTRASNKPLRSLKLYNHRRCLKTPS